MDEPKTAKRKKEKPNLWSSPYPYLGIGLGFAVAAVLIIITTGVLVSSLGFVIPATALFVVGVYELQYQRDALLRPASKERALLAIARDNGGSIVPAEAAMDTSLTVHEADAVLSELAAGGHVVVESKNEALFYSLAGRGDPELEGPSGR